MHVIKGLQSVLDWFSNTCVDMNYMFVFKGPVDEMCCELGYIQSKKLNYTSNLLHKIFRKTGLKKRMMIYVYHIFFVFFVWFFLQIVCKIFIFLIITVMQ